MSLESVINPFARILSDGGALMLPLVASAALLWGAMGARAVLLWLGLVPPTGGPVRSVLSLAEESLRTPSLVRDRDDLQARLSPYRALLKRHSLLIRSLVIVAPLGGLLGTVGGMIETFRSLEQMALFTQGGGVAGGIAQALLTTQMGLAVAIPGIVLGRLMTRRANHMNDQLNNLGERLLEEAAA